MPNDKVLRSVVQIESINLADDIENVREKLNFVLGRVENIVRRGEKSWLPAFPPFPTMSSKGLFFKVVKSQDLVVKS